MSYHVCNKCRDVRVKAPGACVYCEPDMSAIQLTTEDFSAMISGDTSDGTGSTIARQARTIRRLRALADGYRAKYKAEYEHHEVTLEEHGLDLRDAKREERARIVAALRENGGLGDMPNFTLRLDYACNVIADAIERGEL